MLPRKIWYPTRDSNPEEPVSETGAYADSASGVLQNKKPGDLLDHPGFGGCQRLVVARKPPPSGTRAGPPRKTRCFSVAAKSFQAFVSWSVPPNAVPASALTRRKTKSPERSRGPGFGWAQCAYAVGVSCRALFKNRSVCMVFMCKWARIVDPRKSKSTEKWRPLRKNTAVLRRRRSSARRCKGPITDTLRPHDQGD